MRLKMAVVVILVVLVVWLLMLAIFPPNVVGDTRYQPLPLEAKNLEGQVSVLRDRILQLEIAAGEMRERLADLEARENLRNDTQPYDKSGEKPQWANR